MTLDLSQLIPAPKPAAVHRWQLLSDRELLTLPEPAWLLRDIVFAGGLTVLYAMKDAYKSFVALSWAMCIATGTPWLARPVSQGPVVYVLAEGSGFFAKRVAAVRQQLGLTDEQESGVRYVTVPVNLYQPGEVPKFIEYVQTELAEEEPVMFVFDTFARSIIGAEENSNSDYSTAVEHAQALQQTFNAGVLMVHHTGKDGLTARGGYALECAADVVLRLDKTADLRATLTFEHEKDLAQVEPQGLELVPMAGSLVLKGGVVKTAPAKAGKLSTENMRRHIVDLCRLQSRTQLELAGATGRSPRSIAEDVKVLLATERLVLAEDSGSGGAGGAFRYAAGTDPRDTV